MDASALDRSALPIDNHKILSWHEVHEHHRPTSTSTSTCFKMHHPLAATKVINLFIFSFALTVIIFSVEFWRWRRRQHRLYQMLSIQADQERHAAAVQRPAAPPPYIFVTNVDLDCEYGPPDYDGHVQHRQDSNAAMAGHEAPLLKQVRFSEDECYENDDEDDDRYMTHTV